jgi:hypothetical protein
MRSRLEISASSAPAFPAARASGLDGLQAECENDTGMAFSWDWCSCGNKHHSGKEKAILRQFANATGNYLKEQGGWRRTPDCPELSGSSS